MKNSTTVLLLLVALASGGVAQEVERDGIFGLHGSPVSTDPGASSQMQRLTQMVESFGRPEKHTPGDRHMDGLFSGYAMEFYSNSGIDDSTTFSGVTHSFHAINSWALPQTKLLLEAGFRELILSPEQNENAYNHILTAGVRYPLLENEKYYWSFNTGLDLIFYSEEFQLDEEESDGAGLNFQINSSLRHWFGEDQLTAGLALQGLFATKRLVDLGVALGWSRRLHQQLDIGAELGYRITLSGSYKAFSFEENDIVWEPIDFDHTPHSLTLRAHGTYYFNDRIGVEVGYRTHLLIADYRSHAIFVNGQFNI